MKKHNVIYKIITAIKEKIAPDFKIKWPLPTKGLRMIDPFLLLDHMGPIDFAAGEPAGEFVASYDPFVMSHMIKIQQAVYDYEQGIIGRTEA